jgi:hypothetical protein
MTTRHGVKPAMSEVFRWEAVAADMTIGIDYRNATVVGGHSSGLRYNDLGVNDDWRADFPSPFLGQFSA